MKSNNELMLEYYENQAKAHKEKGLGFYALAEEEFELHNLHIKKANLLRKKIKAENKKKKRRIFKWLQKSET